MEERLLLLLPKSVQICASYTGDNGEMILLGLLVAQTQRYSTGLLQVK